MPLQEKLTRRQKELIKELYYSWPAEDPTEDKEIIKKRRIEVSMREFWQPYYKCVNKIIHTDSEHLIWTYIEKVANQDKRVRLPIGYGERD